MEWLTYSLHVYVKIGAINKVTWSARDENSRRHDRRRFRDVTEKILIVKSTLPSTLPVLV